LEKRVANRRIIEYVTHEAETAKQEAPMKEIRGRVQ
jgi:hypothetical protein